MRLRYSTRLTHSNISVVLILVVLALLSWSVSSYVRVQAQGSPGVLSFASGSISVNEGDGGATITLTRTGGADGEVSAKISLTDVTTSTADYRFNPGALDPTFAQVPQASFLYYYTQILRQPDGKLLVGSNHQIFRVNSDGSPDPTFSAGALNGGADDLGQLDADAIDSVRQEAWPRARNPDEMHEALNGLGVVTDEEATGNADWRPWLEALAQAGRATRLVIATDDGAARACGWRPSVWRWIARALSRCPMQPAIEPPAEYAQAPASARRRAARTAAIAPRRPGPDDGATDSPRSLRLPRADIDAALLGAADRRLRAAGPLHARRRSRAEWCERHLLARIHRYTLKRLRREIEPVEPRDFVRFLFEWQHVGAAAGSAAPKRWPAC